MEGRSESDSGDHPVSVQRLSVANRSEIGFAIAAAIIFLILLLPRILAHVPWRDEWQHWLVASVGQCSFSELVARVRYEGHPVAWNAILWAGSYVWNDVTMMKLIHVCLATVLAFVVFAFAPLPRWQRLLMVGGYFFLFEYAVVSRNYSLGVIFLLLAAIVLVRKPNAYIAIASLLALAMQTNAFAGLVATAVCGWFFLRWIIADRKGVGRFAIASVIVFGGMALASWQSGGPPDRVNVPWTLDINATRGGKMLASPYWSFFPIPQADRHWWGRNVLDFTAVGHAVFKPIVPALGLATVALAMWLIPRKRWDLRLLWLGTVLLIWTFGYFKFTGSLRHHGHLFILFIMIWWMVRPLIDTKRERIWIAILAIQCLGGVIASVADVATPFSASKATADYLRERHPDAILIGQPDIEGTCIAGQLRKSVFFPTPGRWGTYVIWDKRRSTLATTERMNQVATELQREHPDKKVLLVLAIDTPQQPDRTKFRELAFFGDSTVSSERYAVLEWQP